MATLSRKSGHHADQVLLTLIFILTAFGLAMLASASSDLGKTQFNDSYYYLKHQIYFGLSLGLFGFIVAYFFSYHYLKKIAFPLLILGIIGLALVFTPLGGTVRNTNRWVYIGPVSFQPAEFMKLAFIIYLAAWLSNPKARRAKDFVEGMLPFALISGFIALLLILQPATSTMAILLGTGTVMYLVNGADMKHLAFVVLIGLLAVAAIVYVTPYRRARILGYLHMNSDTQGENYHINQALIAIGSGGVTGEGYGASATKTSYLPTPMDDSIFAVTAEELGFIGAGGLVALFAMLVLRLLWLARKMRDGFGRTLLIGFGTIIAFQSLVNMAAISGLLPLTGVPLPFVSYGGTALAVFLTMMGIAANVSKYT